MITKQTVFILGAGASRPYGLPSGAELYSRICARKFAMPPLGRRDDDPAYREVARRQVDEFCAALRASGHESVDAFLERRHDLVAIGKRVMACALIPFETPDAIHAAPAQYNVGSPWYKYLLRAMLNGTSALTDNKVAFITFNYDRSFEHFLTSALAANTGISPGDAWNHVRGLPIVHVHGTLGPYHPTLLTCPIDGKACRAYDPELSSSSVQLALDSIRIIHESNDESAEYQQARTLLQKAERAVFLGFGYHPTNMRRLRLLETIPSAAAFGTSFGLTDLERKEVTKLIGRRIDLGKSDWDTLQYLRERVELE